MLQGQLDIDQARKDMLKVSQEAAEAAIPVMTANPQSRLPFHSKEQQHLLRKRHRLETALREVNTDTGLSQVQNLCLQELGLVPQLRLTLRDRVIVARSDQWKALLAAEIQECRNQLIRSRRRSENANSTKGSQGHQFLFVALNDVIILLNILCSNSLSDRISSL